MRKRAWAYSGEHDGLQLRELHVVAGEAELIHTGIFVTGQRQYFSEDWVRLVQAISQQRDELRRDPL